jgi:hypothetical protein
MTQLQDIFMGHAWLEKNETSNSISKGKEVKSHPSLLVGSLKIGVDLE